MCKYSSSKAAVEHFYNERRTSDVLYAAEPSVGLTNAQIINEGNNIRCVFRRKKSDEVPKYFDLSQKYYIQSAYGSYSSGKGIINLQ